MMVDRLPPWAEGGGSTPSFTPSEIRGMWVRTLTLILVVVFSIIIVVGVLSPSGRLLFVLIPLVLTSILFYIGSMSKVVLRGFRVDVLSDSVNIFAPCFCVSLIVLGMPDSMDVGMGSLAVPVFLLGLVGAIGLFSRPVSRQRWIVLRSLTILLVGLAVITALSLIPIEHSSGSFAFALGSLLPGLLSLLGLLEGHHDDNLRWLGRFMDRDRNVVIIALGGVLLLAYINVIRPVLVVDMPNQLPLLEWAIMAMLFSLVVILVFRKVRSMTRVRVTGNWGGRLESGLQGEGDMEIAMRVIDGFILNGRKEELVVILTSTMLANGISEISISRVLRDLLDYKEEEVGIAYKWTYGDIIKARRTDRMELVENLIQHVAESMGGTDDREIESTSSTG